MIFEFAGKITKQLFLVAFSIHSIDKEKGNFYDKVITKKTTKIEHT